MRKSIISSLTCALLIIAIIAAAIVVGFAGASPAAQAQPTTTQPAQPSQTSPEAILAQAAIASENITSGSGEFDISVAVAADPAAMPSGMQALLSQPMSLSGTYTFDGNAAAFESSMTLSIAGQNVPLGLITIGEQAWVQFLGQWYETADMMGTGDTGTSISQADVDSFIQAIIDSGIDPTTWMTDLRLTGEENLDGTAVYHIAGNVDSNKMLADIFTLLQDPMFQQMGSTFGLPTQEDLQSAQQTVSAWLKQMTLDFWVAIDSNEFRQFQVSANVVPPAGEGEGINSITAKATVSLVPSATPAPISPPTDARPFSELEQTLESFGNLFGMGSDTTEPGMTPGTTGPGSSPSTTSTTTPGVSPSTTGTTGTY